MALTNYDQAGIRAYLLGRLSDHEQNQLEERLMVDDEFFEEFEVSKGELIEDYRAGELTADEHKWFEQHFLASPEGKQKYTFALALDCLPRPDPRVQPLTLLERIRNLFRQRWITAIAVPTALAVVLVTVIATIKWPRNVATLSVTSTNLSRSEGVSPGRVSLSGASELRVSLALPEPPSAKSYRAELNDTRQNRSVQIADHDSRTVSVVIPAGQLQPGQYALRLFAITDNGQEQRIPGNYYFDIE